MSTRASILKIAFKYSIIFIFFLVITYLTSFHSYLLFHSLSEVFSIVIAFGIFAVAWNARRFMQNDYLLFIGISLFFIALIDLAHALSYDGMNIFKESGANIATQLWLTARYMQAVSLVAAVYFLNKKLYPHVTFGIYGIVTALLLTSVFYLKIFPVAYIDGSGLTPFKVASEYIGVSLQLLAVYLLYRNRQYFEKPVSLMIGAAVLLSASSSILFSLYTHVYDAVNLAGHIFKMISFYLFYLAIIRTALVDPYKMLFRKLDSQHKFKTAVMNTINAYVVALDPGGRIIMLNNACEKATGYRTDDVRDAYLWDLLVPSEDAVAAKNEFDCLAHVSDLKPGEKCWVSKDGQKMVVSLTHTVLRDHKGRPEFIIATGMDITDKKQAEQEREELVKNLQDALASIKTMRGLIPICSSCKKIRDDHGFWNRIEEYMSEHSEAEFTHGICPECAEKYWRNGQ